MQIRIEIPDEFAGEASGTRSCDREFLLDFEHVAQNLLEALSDGPPMLRRQSQSPEREQVQSALRKIDANVGQRFVGQRFVRQMFVGPVSRTVGLKGTVSLDEDSKEDMSLMSTISGSTLKHGLHLPPPIRVSNSLSPEQQGRLRIYAESPGVSRWDAIELPGTVRKRACIRLGWRR
jgi:hypothetical protein